MNVKWYSKSNVSNSNVVVVPAPADTTSELLLVEKVLALGLDCPPFAVLAFIPISSHECSEGFRFLANLVVVFDDDCCSLLLGGSCFRTRTRRADYKELPLALLETCCFSLSLFSSVCTD